MSRRLLAAVRTAWHDHAFRGVTASIVILVTSATIFYTLAEGWSVLDSLYFSVITGLTIGYGDFAPQGAESKIFTMVYAVLAVGLFVAFGASLARALVANSAARLKRHRHDTHDGDEHRDDD